MIIYHEPRCVSRSTTSRSSSSGAIGRDSADWPLDWREMWTYYAEVENALKISGPVNYPWGPKRPRYPVPGARTQCPGAGAGRRSRSARHRLVADAVSDSVGAARPFSALRLSRHVRNRLLHQRQTKRAHRLAAARARRRCGNPRSRHGRPHRARCAAPRHWNALSARGPRYRPRLIHLFRV